MSRVAPVPKGVNMNYVREVLACLEVTEALPAMHQIDRMEIIPPFARRKSG